MGGDTFLVVFQIGENDLFCILLPLRVFFLIFEFFKRFCLCNQISYAIKFFIFLFILLLINICKILSNHLLTSKQEKGLFHVTHLICNYMVLYTMIYTL